MAGNRPNADGALKLLMIGNEGFRVLMELEVGRPFSVTPYANGWRCDSGNCRPRKPSFAECASNIVEAPVAVVCDKNERCCVASRPRIHQRGCIAKA